MRVLAPATKLLKAKIRWHEERRAAAKLLHPSSGGELPSTAGLCSDSNVREHHTRLTAHAGLTRSKRMDQCLPGMLPVLPGQRSVGYMKCDTVTTESQEIQTTRIVTFFVCGAVGETWYRSKIRSEITANWRCKGALDEIFRALSQNLMHIGWFINAYLGFAVMDCSPSNISETSRRIPPWLRHDDIRNDMPLPVGLVFCDMGCAMDIGTPSSVHRGATCAVFNNPKHCADW